MVISQTIDPIKHYPDHSTIHSFSYLSMTTSHSSLMEEGGGEDYLEGNRLTFPTIHSFRGEATDTRGRTYSKTFQWKGEGAETILLL